MSTRTILALVGVIIILGLGAVLLRQPAEAPTTNETMGKDQRLPTNVSPSNPAFSPPANMPSLGSSPTPLTPELGNQPALNPDSQPPSVPKTTDNSTPMSAVTISVTASGFSPGTASVSRGTRVIFRNESAGQAWPASAMHPTHKVYPGSDIAKCTTTQKNAIFDACGGIAPGASWSFIFNERGSWKYHDHLNASHFGTIVVE